MDKDWTALLAILGELTKEVKNIGGTLKLYTKAFQPKNTPNESKKLEKLVEDFENSPESTPLGDEPKEEVFMDLKDVQCVATTNMAMLVTKKGYQKWIPFSQVQGGDEGAEAGVYYDDIPLTPNGENWIHKKSWDKFEVYKR